MVVEVLWCPNGGRLVVELPDHGALIRCELATDTFVEVVKRIGIERVKSRDIDVAGIPLISTTNVPNRAQRKVDGYYITMGLAPEGMASKLREIAEDPGITLYAELFP